MTREQYQLLRSNFRPLKLDAKPEPFKDWMSVLFDPTESFLFPQHPVHKKLPRLLELLVFLHEYKLHKLARRLDTTLESFINVAVIQTHLNDLPIMFHAYETGSTIGNGNLLIRAHVVILCNIWSWKRGQVTSKKSLQTLKFGQTHEDEEIIGASYYKLMRSAVPDTPWPPSPALTSDDLNRLRRGVMRLGDKWQKISDSWVVPHKTRPLRAIGHRDHTWCGLDMRWLQELSLALGESKTDFYDVIGKLDVAVAWAANHPCLSEGKKLIEDERAKVKADIYDFFI